MTLGVSSFGQIVGGYSNGSGLSAQGLADFYAVVSIAFGIVLCFFGYRWFRLILFLLGFFLGFTVGFLGGAMSPMGILVGLVLGILLGFIFRFVYYLGLFVLGAFCGLLLGAFISTPAVVFFALLGGITAVVFHKVAVIVSTSLVGAFLIVTSAFDLSTGKSLFEMAFSSLVFPTFVLSPDQLKLIVGVSAGVALLGIAVQAATTTHLPARLESNRTAPRARPGELLEASAEPPSTRRGKPSDPTNSEPQVAHQPDVTHNGLTSQTQEIRVPSEYVSYTTSTAEIGRKPSAPESEDEIVYPKAMKHVLGLPSLFPSKSEIEDAVIAWDLQHGSEEGVTLLVIHNERKQVSARCLAIGNSSGFGPQATKKPDFMVKIGISPALYAREEIEGKYATLLIEF